MHRNKQSTKEQRKISLRKSEYILLKNHCSFCWKVECIFPKGPIICFCCYIAVNIGNSYGMGVGVGQLKSEGHFFLAAKENKFYSPGTAQQFLLWSIKHSQESVGVLAEKGAEFVVELVAPRNTLACNMLQICGWAGKAMDGLHGSHTGPEPWDVVVCTDWCCCTWSGHAFPRCCPIDLST